MVKLKLLAVGAIVLTAFVQARQIWRLQERDRSAPPAVGSRAPSLAGTTPGGASVRLEAFTGDVVIVSFWASWCLPCRAEMPEIVRFEREWRSRNPSGPRVVFLAVNYGEEPGRWLDVLDDPLYEDVVFVTDPRGEIADAWNVESIPATFVVDPDGEIRDAMTGYQPRLRSRLRAVMGKYRPRGREG